ncbi:MAG: cupin domain-containing protein [Candidatus Natronoplasma sp.]
MEIINLDEIKLNNEMFSPNRLIQQDEVEVVLLAFSPGQGLKEHTTPVDVFFYVVEGIAEVQVGDEIKQVDEKSIVLSPKDIPHNVKNTSDEDAKILVVKTPKPK